MDNLSEAEFIAKKAKIMRKIAMKNTKDLYVKDTSGKSLSIEEKLIKHAAKIKYDAERQAIREKNPT